jgi:hypothetical protein
MTVATTVQVSVGVAVIIRKSEAFVALAIIGSLITPATTFALIVFRTGGICRNFGRPLRASLFRPIHGIVRSIDSPLISASPEELCPNH